MSGYMQLALEAIDLFPALTFRANLPDEDRAEGSLRRLWQQCWRQKTTTVSTADVCVAFRIRPENVPAAAVLLEALDAYGFLRSAGPHQWHVRGAEKRLGLLRARQKAAAKARGEVATQAPEAPQEPARALPEAPTPAPKAPEPKGMTPAKDIVGRLFGALSSGAANEDGQTGDNQQAKQHEPPAPAEPKAAQHDRSPPAAPPPGKEAGQGGAPGPAKEPRPPGEHQALIDRMTAAFQRIRGAKYGFSGRDAKAVADLRQKYAADDIAARWESALQTEGYRGCSAIYELPAKWNHHTNRSNAAPTSQQLAPTDEEWHRHMVESAKRLGAPQGWHRDQQWLKRVEAGAHEAWSHEELNRHLGEARHDA